MKQMKNKLCIGKRMGPTRRMKPMPRVRMPKADLTKDAGKLIRLGIGAGIGLAAVGVGLSAFKDVTNN